MFLSLLNTEQKKLFLSCAYNLAASDRVFSESEKQAIESYSVEMNMKIKMEDVDNDLARVISNIDDICGIREKKIIIFELIGLAMVDCNYDEGERAIIQNAMSVFGLETEFGEYCEKKLSEYLSLQEELNAKILF